MCDLLCRRTCEEGLFFRFIIIAGTKPRGQVSLLPHTRQLEDWA